MFWTTYLFLYPIYLILGFIIKAVITYSLIFAASINSLTPVASTLANVVKMKNWRPGEKAKLRSSNFAFRWSVLFCNMLFHRGVPWAKASGQVPLHLSDCVGRGPRWDPMVDPCYKSQQSWTPEQSRFGY